MAHRCLRAAAVLLFLVSPACQADALSKTEYVERSGESCRGALADGIERFREEVPETDLSDPEFGEETGESFRLLYETELDMFTTIRNELAELGTPPGDEAVIASFEESLDQAISVSQRRVDAFEAEDYGTLDELTNINAGVDFIIAAEDYGIDCGVEED